MKLRTREKVGPNGEIIIPKGSKVFIDANIFLFPALNHPRYVKPCTEFLQRIRKKDIFWKGIEHSKAAGLLAMDGAHVAVMEAHGLTHLASNDSDFKRASWVKLFQP